MTVSLLKPNTALVLFSGGQDSAVCLADSLSRFDHVETVSFHYGQRHLVELLARQTLRDRLPDHIQGGRARLGEDHRIDLSGFGAIGETALTSAAEITIAETGLPTTFVPARNLVFLAAAGALAYRRGLQTLVGGMCETDEAGYPDCRRAALDAMSRALCLGLDQPIETSFPLLSLSKAQTWALAERLGGVGLVELIRVESHTCYKGVRDDLHDWGYGCGQCPACLLREKGWREYAAP
jgi:7-cyano-7-deazaguanine synthase